MLKFFRRIRRNLLNQGNFSRYSIYAIGEIALVVVGILIALQINNWNEDKKERKLELEILVEISQNLKDDQTDHNQNIEYINRSIRSSKIVLNHLNNYLPYHDSLSSHFGWLVAVPNFETIKSGYQNLLSNGVNIIKNDTLRKKISLLYDNWYSWLRDYLKDRQYNNNQPLLLDMSKKFKILRPLDTAVPIDYQSLMDDHEFNALVQQNLRLMEITLGLYLDEIITLNHELISDIQNEIKRP